MYKLFDKLILFVLCILVYVTYHFNPFHIVFVLFALIFSNACTYYEKTWIHYSLLFIYFVGSLFFVDAVFFIPLLLYDKIDSRYNKALLLFSVPLFIHHHVLKVEYTLILLVYSIISLYLNWHTIQHHNAINAKIEIENENDEYIIKLEAKQKELLNKQDYEIELAKTSERNRIAREIHDSVGHNLSSSLLQIGAMIAINQDPQLEKPLLNTKETLSEGMNSIRNSVHDLHEDTFHLKEEIEKIVNAFSFCSINLQYHSFNLMELRLKYCFINILKEALNNTTKHSNATHVDVTFIENPQFYQFCIWDNGTNINIKDGLGLKSMEERIQSFNGICTITQEHGFKVFINIPKEDDNENYNRR